MPPLEDYEGANVLKKLLESQGEGSGSVSDPEDSPVSDGPSEVTLVPKLANDEEGSIETPVERARAPRARDEASSQPQEESLPSSKELFEMSTQELDALIDSYKREEKLSGGRRRILNFAYNIRAAHTLKAEFDYEVLNNKHKDWFRQYVKPKSLSQLRRLVETLETEIAEFRQRRENWDRFTLLVEHYGIASQYFKDASERSEKSREGEWEGAQRFLAAELRIQAKEHGLNEEETEALLQKLRGVRELQKSSATTDLLRDRRLNDQERNTLIFEDNVHLVEDLIREALREKEERKEILESLQRDINESQVAANELVNKVLSHNKELGEKLKIMFEQIATVIWKRFFRVARQPESNAQLREIIKKRDQLFLEDPLKALQDPEWLEWYEREVRTYMDSFDTKHEFSDLQNIVDQINESLRSGPIDSKDTRVEREGLLEETPEKLTQISGIDLSTQEKLYSLGVTQIENIARWGREDARRISAALDVPEDTIMYQWIFEAQSILFDRHQRDDTSRTSAPEASREEDPVPEAAIEERLFGGGLRESTLLDITLDGYSELRQRFITFLESLHTQGVKPEIVDMYVETYNTLGRLFLYGRGKLTSNESAVVETAFKHLHNQTTIQQAIAILVDTGLVDRFNEVEKELDY